MISPGRTKRNPDRHILVQTTVGVVIAVLAAVVPVTYANASSTSLACGETVTHNIRLEADVSGCGDAAIIVGADDITIDLNGHTVSGTATTDDGSVGILVAGYSGVSISGGSVSGFGVGILLVESSRDTVTHDLLRGNMDKGVILARATDNLLSHNRFRRNADAAVGILDGSDRNNVSDNNMDANGPQAVESLFSNDNVITHDVVTNTGSGIVLESSDGTHIAGNRIVHSVANACDGCGIGIQVYGNGNSVEGNTIVDAPRYGVEVDDFGDAGHSPASGNAIRDNTISGAGEGIAIGPEAGGVVVGTLIDGNRVNNAVDDGIQLVGPSTGLESSTLTGNVAVHNGNWGIEAVPHVIDGGGNIAAANGNRLQCLNVTCRP